MEAEEPPPSSLDDSSSRAWLRSTSQTSAGTHAGREEGICSLASNGLAGCVYWPVNYLSVSFNSLGPGKEAADNDSGVTLQGDGDDEAVQLQRAVGRAARL